jgi:hypothetical protein
LALRSGKVGPDLDQVTLWVAEEDRPLTPRPVRGHTDELDTASGQFPVRAIHIVHQDRH